ncbi:hypothetical protein [Dactylosporangium sp. NPDC005555]|uniref:hypothetical protein n=1 Tax=Dactylosporangium sp. NPDC005555 TaxID=3154889 RepID=UPI0033AF637D
MAAAQLVHDEPGWNYRERTRQGGVLQHTGRLRAWREDGGRLLAMLTVHPYFEDYGCTIPEQVRARFPFSGRLVDVVSYEPGWWGGRCRYHIADPAYAAVQRWMSADARAVARRLGPGFRIDDEADTTFGQLGA